MKKIRRFNIGGYEGSGFSDDEERKKAMRGAITETGAYKDVDMSLLDNYAKNENREGRMSTLDPSDVEDAVRGRKMAGTYGKVEYPNRMREAAEAAGTAGEDTGVGLLAGTNSAKPPSKPPVRTKPPVKTNKPGTSSVKPPDKAPEAAPMGRTAMGKTAEQEMAALEAGRKARGKAEIERLQKEDKPLEQVTPEKNLIGGVPLRGAKAMASGLKEMGSYLKNRFGKDAAPNVAGRLGNSGKKAETLTKDMGPVEYAAGKRSMLQNQKGEGVITPPAKPFPERNKRMLLQNQRGEGVITPPAKPFPERNKRRLLNKNSRSDDTIEMGMKSGGKVSSASRRGDGIAMRGKTRGKYI